MEKYWRSIQLQRRYKKLIGTLMVAHDDLADHGQLTYAAFVSRRDEDRARALEHLETRASDLAAMTEVAGPDMLDALRAETGWLLPEGDVRAAVRRHGVSIADELWEASAPAGYALPRLGRAAHDPGSDARGRGSLCRRDGPRRIPATNGFRLNSGDQLSAAVIDQKKQRLARSPLGTRKTAMENVLTTLQAAAARPGGLDQLLLWQLIDALEARLAAAYLPVSLTRAARELGLDPAEAPMLALAVYTWRQPARGALRKEVETELNRGHIREAQRLTAGLPSDSDIARQVATRLQRMEKQLAEAGQAEDRGQRERAADVLARSWARTTTSTGGWPGGCRAWCRHRQLR